MKGMRNILAKLFVLVLLGASLLLLALTCFAAPPTPPPTPVPLAGEEILIPTLVGYGLYRLRKKNK